MTHSVTTLSTFIVTHMKITSQTPWAYYKKVADFNSTFSSVVITKILLKYLLHALHDALGDFEATKLYYFITFQASEK